MNTIESKVDLLIGVVQDLKTTIDGYAGLRPPVHKWITSNELARLLGMSQRSVLNLVHQGRFPEEFLDERNEANTRFLNLMPRK